MNGQSVNVPMIALAIAAIGNLIGFVWGAAKISSAVEHLTKWADKADIKLENHETRISTLEGAQR